MGRETNIERIRTLETQIAEGNGDVIKLKRARNSLLNISTCFPPEILGCFFKWIITRKQDKSFHCELPANHFSKLERGSFNFRLVCYHWFEVASKTQAIWSFWGNTIHDWNKLHRFSKAAPVDLVLDGHANGPVGVLDTPLKNELKDRIARDKIRLIHLKSDDPNLLDPIISSLTPGGEGVQEKHIESIILHTTLITEELSNFFARSRLPWLQHLEIVGAALTPLWDYLPSHTTRLTTLLLKPDRLAVPLTTSRLSLILTANPNLQYLKLSDASLPDDDGPRVRVPLHHLRKICLSGKLCSVFRLLQRLELPATLKEMELNMEDSKLEDIHQTFGPYIRDFFQRNVWLQDVLDVMSCGGGSRDVYVYVGCRVSRPTSESGPAVPSARFSISLAGLPPDLTSKQLALDLMAFLPQEHTESLQMGHSLETSEEMFIAMPRLTTLWLENVTLSDGFLLPSPKGPYAGSKLLPSLRSLNLSDVTVVDDNWQPLVDYLLNQTPDGEALLLGVHSEFKMPLEVQKKIEGLVKELELCSNINTSPFQDLAVT